MKKLGRKVRNFDQETWDSNCQKIVEEGNEAKFSQNEELKKILYATHPKILAEASPGDRIWGIGLRKDNPLAWDRKTWRGKNLLGYALTRVRDKLMKKDGLIDES
ncbi:hypothetical protein KUTeg_016334 [Tegillarca granosa]|uniref:NADAR domain-containing protein n=1 Tax=Tegillarca granosa TaxID=220873 RepID=A0ABQ9ELL0_TEGGR|nr:hypothetical protein KUTeg_016334 [Tegillarca granosa]